MLKHNSLNTNLRITIAFAAFFVLILSACAPVDYVLGDTALKYVLP